MPTTPLRWTDHLPRVTASHGHIAVLGVAVACAGAASVLVGGSAMLGTVAVVAVTCLVSLLADAVTGLAVGVAGAAAAAVVIRATGGWSASAFPVLLVLAVGLVATGWAGGLAGASVRSVHRAAERGRPRDVRPALGSLGLLDESLAVVRLEEELDRACRHDRPLAIAAIRVRPRPPRLAEDVRPARAAVVRGLDHRLRRSDVPFGAREEADGGAVVGVILPETSGPVAQALIRSMTAHLVTLRAAPTEDRTTGDVLTLTWVALAPEPDESAARLLRRVLDEAVSDVGNDRSREDLRAVRAVS